MTVSTTQFTQTSATAAPPALITPARPTRAEAEDLLFHEARLLDERRLDEWLTLFTNDGLYWTPIDEDASTTNTASLVLDDRLRREERVYHLLHHQFPAQSPRSRTLHTVSNVIVETDGDEARVISSQIIHETRPGDHKQVGLGEVISLAARVEHRLRRVDGELKISLKKILLINRDGWHGNMTYLL